MRSSSRSIVVPCLVVSLGVGACTPESPSPRLVGVSPQWGYSGAETPVRVDGEHFLPRLEALGAQDIAIDGAFSLVLETSPPTALGDVTRTSDTTLAATVPPGLEPGRYDLRVTGPTGATDRLADAFTVTDTRAATVSISTPAVRFDVREDARVELQLRDLSGGEVPASIELEVLAVTASDDPSFVVFQDGLVDQEALGPGHIRGALDSGGGADLYFTSTAVDDVALLVRGLGLNDHIEVMGPQVRFEPATIADATLQVSTDVITAGVPVSVDIRLLDADGNPTRGELLVATLQETCTLGSSGYSEVWTVPDQLTVPEVVLTGATVDGACVENRLRLVGAVSGEPFVAETGPLDVRPGGIARYQVTPISTEVVAGEEAQDLVVRAQDLWANPIPDHTATLSLTDDIGGLDPDAGIGSAACEPFSDGWTVCSAVLERAADAVTVTVRDGDGIPGVSRGFRVVAGPPASLEVEAPTTPTVAGSTFLVSTQARDALGNPATLDPWGGATAVALSDSTGTLDCAGRFAGPSPGLHFSSCAVTLADPSVEVTAAIGALGLTAAAPAFELTNAEVAEVDFRLGTTALVAGDPLDFHVEAFDAFRNPYLLQTTSTVLVEDLGGELAPTSISLDAAGQGSGSVTPVRATTANALLARVLGTVRGQSDDFSVAAGPQTGFAVDLGTTWVEVDTATQVRITAVDAYQNRVPGVTSSVSLSSVAGAGVPLAGVSLTDGIALPDFTWDLPTVQDGLTVSDGSLTGASGPVDVVDLDCADGPTADLTVAGESDLRLCLVGGQTSDVTVSAAGSTAGDQPLASYHLRDGTSSPERRTAAESTERWTEEGARILEVLVVDDDACADRAVATVWIGPSNGEPVGLVSVSLDDTTLTAGSASGGTTTVQLAAWDCAGDPASGGTLGVRADLGSLSSAGSTLSASGAGLEVGLDASGAAELQWSMAAVDVAGSPAVHAGVPSGAAYGQATATVTGDARSPIPVALTPAGTTTDAWSTIVLGFSEPLFASSVVPAAFTLLDPDGLPVDLLAATLSSDGQTVTLEPEVPMDGSLGEWWLTASSVLRDDGGGNLLDGDWTGAPSDFVVALGDVAESAPPVTACSPSTDRFRPDGDAGVGADADQVDFSAVAASPPTWWWLTVASPAGEIIAWQPTLGTASAEVLSWSGRGIDGHVVAAGDYTVTIAAVDDVFSDDSACSSVITVEHPIDAPERP